MNFHQIRTHYTFDQLQPTSTLDTRWSRSILFETDWLVVEWNIQISYRAVIECIFLYDNLLNELQIYVAF